MTLWSRTVRTIRTPDDRRKTMTTHKTGTREQWLAARLELLQAEKELTIEVAHPKVVPPVEWLAARNEFLTKEKELTRLRDELSRQRRALPWGKVGVMNLIQPGAR
jgi:predicted dithiol-disulfide oxidoreductase (DUF899 family)